MVLLSVAASVIGASVASGAAGATVVQKLTSSELELMPDSSARAAVLGGGNSTLDEAVRHKVLCQMTGARRSRWRNVMLMGDVIVVSCKNIVENLVPLQGAEVHVQDCELTIESKCSQVGKFWLESEEQAQQWASEMESAGRCVERVKKLEVAVAEIPEYQNQISEQQKRIAELEETTAGQELKVAELEEVIARQRKKVADLEGVIAGQRNKIADLEVVITGQNEKVAERDKTIGDLQEQLSDVQGFATKKNAQLATLQGDLEDLMVTALPEALNRVHEVLRERVKSAGEEPMLKDKENNEALMDTDIIGENGTTDLPNLTLCDGSQQDPVPMGELPVKEENIETPGPLGTSKKKVTIRARSGRSPPPANISIRVGSPTPAPLSLGPNKGIRSLPAHRGQKP